MPGFGSSWLSSSPFRGKRSTDSSSPAKYQRSANATTKGEQHTAKQPKFQFQTLVFKVQVHCDACMGKVKKAIASIEGVESISVDLKQKRITVTGHFDQQKLLKRVAKTGKQVELITNKDGSSSKNTTTTNNNGMIDQKPLMVFPMDSSATGANAPLFSLQFSPAEAINSNINSSFMFSDENVNGCCIM
ncbi:heavy metal-associated isoprenylated plant protein 28 [Selaginella moellendorffii]|uniref:heavy metal-associated isoprenylated plant protein 28 n=1 Tax=Selaginella moellendorffii TaxID=88036 RepID=UPI000D1CD48A|nr:heavy metal-associated isoprenylated plant protein 28 [Selaginella moellendorffii]|eukprot:XP_002975678.2 heavy metal-associated isoprenylated plant protein 28 [Selaginella moellendorffii]